MNASEMKPTGLLCEVMDKPDAVAVRRPHFGWIVPPGVARQKAFRLQVASCPSLLADGEPDLWDSGRVESDRSLNVSYEGKALEPLKTYYWRVCVWGEGGEAGPWSDAQKFATAGALHDYACPHRSPEVTRVSPVQTLAIGEGRWFIDFGRAAFGTIELNVESPDAREIEVHLGEKKTDGNRVDREPRGTIRYRRMTLAVQPGRRTYQVAIPPDKRNTGSAAIKMPPAMFEVLPFRYAEIANCPSEIHGNHATQLAVHYPFDEQASDFLCDDPNLNAVWDICKYSIKATSFCGVYVDGDRERIPYEADAYINQLCHYGVDREYTMARYSHEYLMTHPTWPTEWILHSVLMAWADYLYTGDDRSLRRYYDDLKAKTLHMLAREDGLISSERQNDDVRRAIHIDRPIRDLVDWPPASFTRDGRYGERDGYDMRPINTVVNAYHYRALELFSRIARALGRSEEAADFAGRARKVRRTMNEKLFDRSRGIYIDGEGSDHAALHANMFPLAFGIVPDEHIASVVAFVKSRGMACSVYGAQYLLEALYAVGQGDYAFSLMTAGHDRGWLNMIHVGSTVTLEAWDWKYKNNLDWNHAWGAAPANAIPRGLFGIEPIEPGGGRIRIAPQPGPLTWARIKTPTIRGPVYAEMHRRDGEFCLEATFPGNTIAEVRLPLFGRESAVCEQNGREVKHSVKHGFALLAPAGSGTQRFRLVYD